MKKHHLILWLNFILIILCASVALLFFYYQFINVTPLKQPPIKPAVSKLPPSPFAFQEEVMKNVGERILYLHDQIPSIRLPDIRPFISFHGKNSRPDAKSSKEMFFSIAPAQEIVSFEANTPIYLEIQEGKILFSPKNESSHLWFTAIPQGAGAKLEVFIKDEAANVYRSPLERAQFTLPEKPLTGQQQQWNINSYRVDGTLLFRLGAKWAGRDLFLEQHGGDEFFLAQGKQRIVLGDGENKYSLYVDQGDQLIWKDGKFSVPENGENTEMYPLLQINKIEERLMGLTLYDISNKHKTSLNLLKIQDLPLRRDLNKDFQFLGAKTRIHSTFKVGNQREMVGPGDWFLFTSEGWKKIKTGKEIDQYVSGQLVGPLLVIERIKKDNEDRFLEATLYGNLRSHSNEIEISLKPKPVQEKEVPKKEKVSKEKSLEANDLPPSPSQNDS